MAQIFHPSMNEIAKISILAAALLAGTVLWVIYTTVNSPAVTNVGIAQPQPVQFSHQHHVKGLGIECAYCHTSVEKSAFAGIPPVSTCMNCHSQIWYTSPILEPIRESYKTGKPIQWNRVHNVADFVYFNHGIHVNKGVGCVSCHGRVDQMQLMHKDQPMTMAWCLDCHRNPQGKLRPKSEIYNMAYERKDPQEGARLMKEYKILSTRQLTSCSTCHR